MSDDVSQRDNKAARPRVTSRSRDRRPNSSPADENIPNAGGPPQQEGEKWKRDGSARRPTCESTRGSASIVPQTEDAVTYLTRAETLAPKPLGRNVAQELAREMCLDVRSHRLKGKPPMRGVGMIRAGRNRAEDSGLTGIHRLILRESRGGANRRAAATTTGGRRARKMARRVAGKRGSAEAAGARRGNRVGRRRNSIRVRGLGG